MSLIASPGESQDDDAAKRTPTDPPIRVLIADDRPVARKLLGDQLERDADLEVVAVARDGDEAVACVRHERPDVVLMDVVMPGKDGIQALAEIRSFSDVPVILLTGAQIATASLEYVARRRGADAFFLKPSGNISLDLHTIGPALVAEIRRLTRSDDSTATGSDVPVRPALLLDPPFTPHEAERASGTRS